MKACPIDVQSRPLREEKPSLRAYVTDRKIMSFFVIFVIFFVLIVDTKLLLVRI